VNTRLLMLVERDAGGRFGGEIFQPGRGTLVGFSGTLERFKALENLVSLERLVHNGVEGWGPGRRPGPSRRAGWQVSGHG
jgi:hypothetical protein